jgi:hypothetical protein
MSDINARLETVEQQLRFVMQTLSLTRQTPDGKTDARSLTALFEEMQNHAGTTSQTFADVAQRAFTTSTNDPNHGPDRTEGPDGFSGATGYDHSTNR